MKKYMLCCCLCSLLLSLGLAQDRIIKRDGTEESVKVLEVTPTQVKYKKFSRQDGPIYTISKSEIFKITYEDGSEEMFRNIPSSSQRNITSKNYRSPGTAMALSFLIPGGGQYYNADYLKGGIMTGVYVGGWILMISGISSTSFYDNGGTALTIAGAGLILGSYIWSIIDAPIGAQNYNEKMGLLGFGNDKLFVRIEPFNSPGLGGSISLSF